ncbi:glycosyltransferase family 8 protein [Pseudogemmobacter blasticus]|uniref:Glycosyltransferase family 8 protein n=1 Tax=Fuscovulum blasticum DSM 2131 TaxID=1188250 RepID=A0A2T4JA75_FUSBL|nr:glycosyltransferase family 8 protein [Fuscovulum blasticum]PTE14810.1 hypothetical protein C5F44_08395 [Fuscovulum blasticum DSM 2131]
MHIVTGSDENYVTGVAVLIASVARFDPGTEFTVLDHGISPRGRDMLQAVARRIGCPVTVLPVDPARLSGLSRPDGTHVTPAGYLRLLIPEMLPHLSRVIYMDCDMVAVRSIAGLWATDLEGRPVGAVRDAGVVRSKPEELIAMDLPAEAYFNSGLLVMDLDLWRSEGIAGACLDWAQRPDRQSHFADQSALNHVLRGRVTWLDDHWNVLAQTIEHDMFDGQDLPEDLVPGVLHYCGKLKPWRAPVFLGKIWQAHAAPLADLIPPDTLPRLTLRDRLHLLERRRRRLFGLALRRRKYVKLRQIERRVEARIVRPALDRLAQAAPF